MFLIGNIEWTGPIFRMKPTCKFFKKKGQNRLATTKATGGLQHGQPWARFHGPLDRFRSVVQSFENKNGLILASELVAVSHSGANFCWKKTGILCWENIPSKPTTFIFSGYDPYIYIYTLYIEGLKTFIFHGFWGPMVGDPLPETKSSHLPGCAIVLKEKYVSNHSFSGGILV